MRALLLILTCLLASACSAQKVAEQMAQQNRPDPAASAQMAQQKQIKDMEYMQRRAEYDRKQEMQKAYLRQPGLGQPLPPPPPDPANTQPFVPPPMDIKGTPAALAAPDARAIIEKAYEDFDYAYLTRDINKCMAISADVLVVDGEKLDRAGQRKYWQEEFQAINDLEAKVEQTLRVGSSTEILKLTPKGPDKVAVQVRSINRLMATASTFRT